MNVEFSVVVPVCNEAENVEPLAREIDAAMRGRAYEMIFVDDGSTDDTPVNLLRLKGSLPALRVLRHSFRSGQSAAVASGVRAAHAAWVATLDGDGQNDPADIPKLIEARDAPVGRGVQLFMGNRTTRKDTPFRQLQSRIANGVRGAILRDGTRDTGCGLKAVRRDVMVGLPYFDGLHRFLPALVKREGYEIGYVDVVDRPRRMGTSNYGLWDRLWVGILDLAGVWWLIRRRKRVPQVSEVKSNAH
jgi:dolichol-phosphate mannosyltransferase